MVVSQISSQNEKRELQQQKMSLSSSWPLHLLERSNAVIQVLLCIFLSFFLFSYQLST